MYQFPADISCNTNFANQ